MNPHTQPPRRRRKLVALAAALVLVPATAWAVYYFTQPVSGSLEVGDGLTFNWYTPNVTGPCAVSLSSGTLHVTTPTGGVVYPGDSCTITTALKADSDPGIVTGLKLTGLPESWVAEATLDTGCGSVVNDTASKPVVFTITVPDSQPVDGSTISFGGSDAGVQLAPYTPTTPTPSSCPVTR